MAKRLRREWERLEREPVAGVSLTAVNEDLSEIVAALEMPEDSLYAGEPLRLRLRFSRGYPMEAPEVVFLDPVPVHEHVYGNGHICLSTLYADWSPALNIGSVCVSIVSMLASAQVKVAPEDNERYVRQVGMRSPKDTNWDFHDETC